MSIEIKHEVTDEEIALMAQVMRPEEREDFEQAFGSVEEGLFHCCGTDNHEIGVAYADDELLAIFGCSTGWLEDTGNPWLVLAKDREEYALQIVRHCQEVVQKWAKEFKLLANFVPLNDTDAIRLLQMIGFQFLSEQVESDGYVRIPFYMLGGKR